MYYRIQEFAKLIQVSESTLRLWDKTGELKPHHYTKGGHRVYASEQADRYMNRHPELPLEDMTTEELESARNTINRILQQREQEQSANGD